MEEMKGMKQEMEEYFHLIKEAIKSLIKVMRDVNNALEENSILLMGDARYHQTKLAKALKLINKLPTKEVENGEKGD